MSDTTCTDAAAISAALNQNWNEAIRINLALLKTDKDNISYLNRLGFAYLQSGQLTSAKKTFQRVIKLDEYNQIALKNLGKLTSVRQKDVIRQTQEIRPMSFLEEPGKTKIVECINAAPAKILASVFPGEPVELKAKNHTVEIRSTAHTYLAALPDDLSFRLIRFMGVGNTYQAIVKGVSKNTLVVFIRELSRGKRYATQPSFSSSTMYVPFSRADRPDDAPEDAAPTDTDQEE